MVVNKEREIRAKHMFSRLGAIVFPTVTAALVPQKDRTCLGNIPIYTTSCRIYSQSLCTNRFRIFKGRLVEKFPLYGNSNRNGSAKKQFNKGIIQQRNGSVEERLRKGIVQ